MDEMLRCVLWQGLFRPGAEWCDLARAEDGWSLSGTALVAVGDEPFCARYDIALGPDWSTREARVTVRAGADARQRRLSLRVNNGRWLIERAPEPSPDSIHNDLETLRGLIDVDLEFTPATNTLPIRRLALPIGEAADVTALWVRFPELTTEPLPQRYTRLSEFRYRYQSAGGAFVAELEVDDLDLVVSYEGGWRRIATSPPD